MVVLAIAVVVFDWNWLRHPIERYLTNKSGRQVTIGDLDVTLGSSLAPTVRLRGIHVENAPWAAKRPLIIAGEVRVTVALSGLWDEPLYVSRVVLADADIDMERRADGLRNWRLTDPEYRGPGRVQVGALEAHRTQLRFVNGEIDLELNAAASDLDKEQRNAANEALVSRVVVKGTYRGASYAGEALTGEAVTFRRTGRSFPIRGHLTSGKTRLDIDGSLTDVFDIGPIDAKVRLAGPTLSQLYPFLRIQPPPSQPFEVETHLLQADKEYKFLQLKGRIGGSDLTGDVVYDRRPERPIVHATLRSEKADVADLAPLVGVRAQPGDGDKTRPLHVEGLKTVDARVTMHAAKLKASQFPMLESLRGTADLTDGVLELKPIDLGVAGGHVAGSATFNGSTQPASVRATVELRSIQLERLVPSLSEKTRSTGAIYGHVRIASQGRSIAQLFGSATGTVAARMDRGSISNLADAKLGLNRGKALGLMVRGDQDIAINCAAVAFDFKIGVGTSQTMALDTEETHVDGTATIDLRESRLDLLLTPQPKKPGLFTREASIRFRGPFAKVDRSLEARVALPKQTCETLKPPADQRDRRSSPR